jgi:hypothetical protein
MTDRILEFRADGVDDHALEQEVVSRAVGRVGPALLKAPRPDSTDLPYLLGTLQDYIDQVQVTIDVRDQQLPMGNALWNRIKYQFHELVYIYTNDLAGRQYAVNQQVALTLETLIQRLDADLAERDARIAGLEAEVKALRQRFES